MTSNEAKTTAGRLALDLTRDLKPLGVTVAFVDDWGDYNNFSILIYLSFTPSHCRSGAWRNDNKQVNLRKIVPGIKRVCKQYTEFYRFDMVQRLYTKVYLGGAKPDTYFDGYDTNYISLSVDLPD